MQKMTITEALAKTKILKAKITSRKESTSQNLGRMDITPDPFEKEDGGSAGKIKRDFQAMADFRLSLVATRTAIQNVNSVTRLRIGEREMSVTDWLNWKREVADEELAFLKQAQTSIQQLKNQNERSPQVLKDKETGESRILKPVFNIDQAWLEKQIDIVQTTLGELDGKLSMLNATTFIEV